ncbi:solute carrier organic anion transporter family member 5A1-like [Limulus polyphemus]|uniref:Solute carrier organic anion transporter family member n=1 Tax=Limulus polyphemus TaxID=6850 RepID=A0ABM1TB48_LIMPO|nr:solute carrier organic anion transporter family member 5A1-like [Limulus polyphemus]
MGIGSLVFSLPYFLDLTISSYFSKLGLNASRLLDENTCRISPVSVQPVHAELPGGSHFAIQPPSPDVTSSRCQEGTSSNVLHILIFMVSQVLIGCGGSPIFTLGTTYIDDHVKKESSSMYIGCMYSTSGLGLVFGFLLGGYFLSIHEDAILYDTVPYDIHPGSPRWVGAWWAGFVLYGFLLTMISIPFFAFPKTLKKEKERLILETRELSPSKEPHIQEELHMPGETQPNPSVSKEAEKKQKYGKDVKDIPASMWHLISNPIYIITCLGACMELSIVNGFIIFLPKYLETQFNLDKSEANVFTGGIAIPGACVGIFLGGYLLKRFQLRPKGAIQFVMFFNILSMGLFIVLYFLGCDNIRMAGATLPYFNNTELEHFQVNLTADCNLGCQCTPKEIEPVCGQNGITYFSPCHAGCRLESGRSQMIGIVQNFTSCACIPTNKTILEDVTAVPLATYGSCPQVCKAMIPFMLLLFTMTLVVSIMQMPVLMITLRSVSEEERSFALGMQFVIFRLFGYIPSPIMFGNVIDSTCLVWKAYCGRPSGFCLMHDIEQFRLRYIGMCTGLKVVAGCLFFLDWVLISWKQRKDIEHPVAMTLGELVSSVISLDRLSTVGWGDFSREDVRTRAVPNEEDEMQPLEDDKNCPHPEKDVPSKTEATTR